MSKKRLVNAIHRAAERSFIDWNAYYKHADEVILFGSWALGVERRTSDIDVLCIGQGKSVTSSVLHILCMSRSRFRQHVLRGSELASHVAAYGIWLKGTRSVPKYVGPSHATVDRRRRLLDSRVRALCAHWQDLRVEFKRKHADKVRRDLQRLNLLKMGRPNIPAPVLDDEWKKTRHRSRRVSEWLHNEPRIRNSCAPSVLRLIRSGATA